MAAEATPSAQDAAPSAELEDAIIVRNLGKRLRRSRSDRPTTLQEVLARAFQARRSVEDSFWALKDVSFSVQKGTTLGIIGRNGAGKSTLMRLIGGVGRPNTGSASVRGRIGALLDLGAGFHPDLTGRENVYINGTISGLTRAQISARFDSITAFSELEDFMDAPLRTYSSGMQMRLGFAIAAHTEPGVLLVDEVLAVGDAAFQEKCLQWIEGFKHSGRTIVLVSHDTGLVRSFCDQVLWLEKGEIAAYGPAEKVVGKYVDAMLGHGSPASSAASVAVEGVEREKIQTGTGEIQITGLQLLNEVGQPVRDIRSGQAISFEISWHAAEPRRRPLFWVGIRRPDGTVCFETSTERGGLNLAIAEGSGKTLLHLERLDLVTGTYLVDTGIFGADWEGTYHTIRGVETFAVNSDTPDEPGILHAPHRWETVRNPGK